MTISKLTIASLAAAAGFSALALAPAHAGDLYISNAPVPVYEPAPVYEAYPVQERRVIVREVPAERVIVRERGPAQVYVRDVPVPPAPVGGYYDSGYEDDAYGGECRTMTRETPSGRIIAVGNTCD